MAPSTNEALSRPARGASLRIPEQRGGQPTPDPRGPDSEDETPISVVALLRREGVRVPHATERPLQPRAHQLAPEETSESWLDSVVLRRAGAAAGALVAAASVLCAAVLTDTGDVTGPAVDVPAAPPDGGGVTSLPGLALLGPQPPGSVSLAAFQGSHAPAPAAILLPGGSTSSPDVPVSTPAAPRGLGGTVNRTATGVSRAADSLGNTVQGTTSTLGRTVDRASDTLGKAVGGPVGDVVKSTGSTLGGVVEGGGNVLGDVVKSAGGAVDGATRTLTAPVAGLLGASTDSDRPAAGRTSQQHAPALSTLDQGSGSTGGGLVQSLGRTASGLLGP